jgi:glycosyltransferase involved in cell wall biosynthesis
MKKSPKVSVVLPTFNRASELPRSVHSVLSQTFSDFELIIVDDASTDGTEDVVKAIGDGRIRYVKLKENVGGAEARNVGIRIARGDTVAFQDSDDEWTVCKLARSVKELESDSNVGAVFSAFIQVDKKRCTKMPSGIDSVNLDKFYDCLLWQNVVGTPTLVARRSVLDAVGGFDASMPRYQDWELALRMAKITRFKFIDEPLIISHVTKKSITQNKKAHRIALEKIYDKHAVAINENGVLKAAWLHRLGDARMIDGIKGGRSLLVRALMHDPLNVRYLVKTSLAFMGNERLYRSAKSLFGQK